MGIITISRAHGSGGTNFAAALAKRLDYKFVNRTFINNDCQLSQDHVCVFGLNDDDSPSFLERIQELKSNRNYFKVSLMANIYDYALKNNVVFVGMGAGIILSGTNNLLNMRVVRLLAERVKAIAQIKNISYEDAFDLVEKMDEGKKDFISHYFDMDIGDPTLYHLMMNSSYVSLDDGLDMVSEYVKKRLNPAHTIETERFLKNRLLEKRAEILLFRLGMVGSYGKINFEATDDAILIVKGVIGGKEEKKELLESLDKNKEINKIEDHLKVGILSGMIY
jgi:cytidylate kinase